MLKAITISSVLTFLLTLLSVNFGVTQETLYLQKEEKVMQSLYDSLANAENDDIKEDLNQTIIQKWDTILKDPASFAYPFDSLDKAGILTSPDERIRIYNWNLPHEAGTHTFFCFLQYKPEKRSDSTLLFQLFDHSSDIKNPQEAILTSNKWYGALYYRIIPIETRFDETYYTLLGYDPHDYLTNKKVIDVLRFRDNKPIFGASIFKNQREITNRIIFEYGEFASMMLKYDEDKEMIVYDHLSPSKPIYEGQREFYGPDFSYDGLKYENGVWNTYFDLDLRLQNINLGNQ